MKKFLLFGRPAEQAAKEPKEDKVLRALRKEVSDRIKVCEKKEAELREFERKHSQREAVVRSEEARIPKLKEEQDRWLAEIERVKKTFDEKQSALDVRNKAISRLTKEMSSMLEKQAEMRRAEADFKSNELKNKRLCNQLAKVEKRIAYGSGLLAKLEEDIEKHLRILSDARAQVDQVMPAKKQVDAAKKELAEVEQKVGNIKLEKEELQKRAASLAQREQQIITLERKALSMKKNFESLRADAEVIQKDKQELVALIEEKRHIIEDLKKAIAENHQRAMEAHDSERKARQAEQNLLSAQRETDRKLKLIESKSLEMTRTEAAFLDHERALKDASRMLARDKTELANEVNSRKAELLLVQQEWEKKFGSLSGYRKDLEREKTNVKRLVDMDVAGLKEKEDEVITAIAMMEHDRDKLELEEKSLLKRVAELERDKAAVDKLNKSLALKEKHIVDGERVVQKGMKFIEDEKRRIEREKDEIYRARELKKLLPKLQQRYEELRKSIGQAQARFISERVQPSALQSFREREKELSVREKGVDLEVRRLLEHEREVEQLEERKERAFSEYLREEVERVQQGKPGKEVMNPEIHAMIDDARERLMRGQLDEAVRLVAEAEYLVDKLQDASQKRLFYYDIRDLKTSIKLASLT